MTACGATSGGSDAPIAAYEKLRRQVIAGTSVGGSAGRFLLQREGVVCWMSRRVTAPVAPPKKEAAYASGCDPLDQFRAGIVQMLADLACHGLGEANL